MTNEEIKKELTDEEILFLTIIGEARGEPIEGQIAVANVIVNRAIRRQLPIKDICLQRLQFSCWNDNDPNRAHLNSIAEMIYSGGGEEGFSSDYGYKQIKWVVDGVMRGLIHDNTKSSDHYMTTKLFNSDKRPSWARNPKKDPITIGNHTFLVV